MAKTELNVTLYSTKPAEEPKKQDEPVNVPSTANTGVLELQNLARDPMDYHISPIIPIAFAFLAVFLALAFFLPRILKRCRNDFSSYSGLKRPKFAPLRYSSLFLASLSLLAGAVSFSLAEGGNQVIKTPSVVALEAGIIDTDYTAVVHTTVSVPATLGGFSLYVSSTTTDLIDINNSDNKIPTIEEVGPLTENSFGVYVGPTAPTSDSDFYPVYSDAEGKYKIYTSESSKAEEIDVWYGIRAKSASPSTYATSLTIEAIKTHETLTLQQITPTICQELELGVMDHYKFEDSRDGKLYSVARMNDGNCWLTENLDLDLSPDITLTPKDTDVREDWTPSVATSTDDTEDWGYGDENRGFCFQYQENTNESEESDNEADTESEGDANEDEKIKPCAPYSFDSGNQEDGNYYNIFAASAGSVKASVNNDFQAYDWGPNEISFSEPTASICPSGWAMASADNYTDLFSAYGLEQYLYFFDAQKIDRKIPNFTDVYTGFYLGSSFTGEASPFFSKYLKHFNGLTSSLYAGSSNGFFVGYATWKLTDEPAIDELLPIFYARPTHNFEPLSVIFDDWQKDLNLGPEAEESEYNGLHNFMGASVRCFVSYPKQQLRFEANSFEEVENLPNDIINNQIKSAIDAQDENNIDEPLYNFVIPQNIPERKNAVFAGWSRSPKREASLYYPGDTIEFSTSNLTLYATWLDRLEVEDKTITLQAFTPDICKTLEIDKTYGLEDIRDKKAYSVARLQDGKCWMTQNLALGGDSEIELTPDNSNVSSNKLLPKVSEEAENDSYRYAPLVSRYSDLYKYISIGKYLGESSSVYGHLYNYTAATAMIEESDFQIGERESDAADSICPNGWRLPKFAEIDGNDYDPDKDDEANLANFYKTESNDYANLLSYYSGIYTLEIGELKWPILKGRDTIFKEPLSFPRVLFPGADYDSFLFALGGQYWTSTIFDDNEAYSAFINSYAGIVFSGQSTRMNDQGYIRCLVAPEYDETEEELGNKPESQPTTDNSPSAQSQSSAQSHMTVSASQASRETNNIENTNPVQPASTETDNPKDEKSEPLGVVVVHDGNGFDAYSIIILVIVIALISISFTAILVINKRNNNIKRILDSKIQNTPLDKS